MPLSIPLIVLLVVMYTPTYLEFSTQTNSLFFLNNGVKLFLLRSFALFGFVFPVISILILKYSRQIDSLQLDNQRQRTVPLFLSGMYAIMLFTLLMRFQSQVSLSAHLFSLTVSGAIIAFVSLLINLRFKVSLHASGAGILLGFMFSYYMEQSLLVSWPIYMCSIVAGLIIASRIFLRKHTISELLIGFNIGFFVTFLTDYLFVLYF